MILIKGVKSKTKPVEVDDISSNTTVYVRENIVETIEIDPVFYEENVIYIYDEKQYSWREWFKLNMERVQKQINELKELVTKSNA